MMVHEIANLHSLMHFTIDTVTFCKARNGIITTLRGLAKQPEIPGHVAPLATFEMLQTSLLLIQMVTFEKGKKRKALFEAHNLEKQQEVYEAEVDLINQRVQQINSNEPEWFAVPTFTPSRL